MIPLLKNNEIRKTIFLQKLAFENILLS